MDSKPVITRDQGTIDAEHLRLLTIFHYVSAFLSLLGLVFLFGHYMVFHSFFENSNAFTNSKSGPPPAVFMQMFKWFYVLFGIWTIGNGIANLLSGVFIRARKHHMFSLIVAGLNCLSMPLGTILGVFTFIVLLRESVVKLYKQTTG